MLRAHQKIRERAADHRHRGILCALVFAMLMVTSMAMAILEAPVFDDVSPTLDPVMARPQINPPRVQLAQADLPKGVGSLSDYMNQSNDGPTTAAVPQPPQSFYPQAPQRFPQGIPSQEWNSLSANPNAARTALIGAAVVGAVAVGLWAWHQHELHQVRGYAPRRFPMRRRAYR